MKITSAQERYLRILCNEAFGKLYPVWNLLRIDANHLSGLEFSYASKCIDHLLAAKKRGWTVLEPSAAEIAAEEARTSAVRVRVAKIKELRALGFRCTRSRLTGPLIFPLDSLTRSS
jgi:hypothetical protein